MSQASQRFEKRIVVTENNVSAVDLLAQYTPLSKQVIKATMVQGAVWLTSENKTVRIRRAKRFVNAGDVIQIYYDRHLLEQQPAESTLVADCERYSVWDKAENILAQGSQWGDHCSLLRFADQYFQPVRPAFLVHRLDREATGLMLIAHDKKAAAALSTLFQSRDIDKYYRIEVEGIVSEAEFTVDQPLDGKAAISHYTRLSVDEDNQRSVLDVNIETGRKHQIRRHIADYGYPIVGDKRYGSKQTGSMKLRAYRLVFRCPLTRKNRQFEIPA